MAAVHPPSAIEGGRVTVEGTNFPNPRSGPPAMRVGDVPARVVYASSTRLSLIVPPGVDAGPAPVQIDGLPGDAATIDVAAPFATGLHQVDNPVFDRDGNLYVTYSGTRGQQVPVSIFRVTPSGTRETFSSGIVNPTSMAIGPDGELYVSSRFEGTVYRVRRDGSVEPFATDLGVACGLVFDSDGTLLVGDRSGTIFRVTPGGQATTFAALPSSVAAFHLAISPSGDLFVTAPTLATYDSVYRIDRDGAVSVHYTGFGRPQGLAFDPTGQLFVVEALAGASGVYRVSQDRAPELALAGPGLVGVAFAADGTFVVSSNDTAYRSTSRRRA